jgi:hypothetical protein
LLQDVHSNIVQQKLARKYPLMIEGAGGDDAAKPLFYALFCIGRKENSAFV